MFFTVLVVGHLEGELALPIHAVGRRLVVLVQHAKGVVFPVELCEDVEAILVFGEVNVALEEVSTMDAELIFFKVA